MTTVVKISGKPIEHPEACIDLWRALAAAHQRDGLIVVHGGGVQVDARLAALGFETRRVDGQRVTPPDQIGVVAGVLAGEVNRTVVGCLSAAGAAAVGLGLSDGGLVAVRAQRPELGRVGTPIGGDAALVRTLLGAGYLPVVHSIGHDAAGGPLNINADDAAAAVATVLNADRLLLLTDVHGVLDGDGTTIPELDGDAVDAHIASRIIRDGMAVKARAAVRVAESCDADVVVGGWPMAGELLGEPFTGPAGGTRIRRRYVAASL